MTSRLGIRRRAFYALRNLSLLGYYSILAPKDRLESEEDLSHWANNQEMTWTTLDEDFSIGENIQAGLKSGANEVLTFGRFEGALAAFNENVNTRL